jgi:peptidoglycan-associated lipoprotein
MTKARGHHGWLACLAIVTLMITPGAVGCKKKGPTAVESTGGRVTGDEGMSAREAAIREAQSQLMTVYFDYDSYTLRPDAQATLRTNAGVIEKYPDVRVQIQGHCDERGSEEYNLALGDRRARAIMDYLVNLGIAPDRLSTITFGEERPVDPGHDEVAWSKNRRGEFVAE